MSKDINVLKSNLVPKHEIISMKEKQKLLDKFNIVEEQLPKISIKDPVAKVLDAQPSDVIRIIRKSEISGQSKYYRLVIEK